PGMTHPHPTNRHAHATSPDQHQHPHNPVDWYEWGDEALARARAEDRPLLLSIGYSACHWCHVMAHESFEDPATAALMNAHFVNVKVDREERPDLDDIYMAATQAMNQGQGGWPMTVFLTPDQRPFFAGTYFPPRDGHGRPGFPTLLRRIAELWERDRARLEAQGSQLTDLLRDAARAAPGAVDPDATIEAALASLARSFDATWGGFGRAPKFPPSQSLRLLLRAWRRRDDPQALRMVTTTLDAMAAGGMHDHLAGGFCRYSTDERWLVPHFEKMLYDNAQLAVAYLEGWQATGRARYAEVAARTLDYVLREMTAPEGGFWSATDADSEGEEGRFFVWTPAQVHEVVDPADAALVLDWFDIREGGNWEGHAIPNTPQPLATVAARHGITETDASARIARARDRLLRARAQRVPPALDDKILTAWNGLMLGAMADGARVLGERRWRDAAVRAADFALESLRRPDGGLYRTWRRGTARLDGYLEDYAFLADGLVSLYEAGADARYLREARVLMERVRTEFRADDGGFYGTGHRH
ncbi:MAG: thioredoxin domain-containing protein, partial [Gemmatimonadales bacterium]|nr:thioredoxin domain-containing protein [Gemmatimonadales bacterium]